MKICLVRHGQTESNYEGIIQGRENVELNDTGRRQCKRLSEKIKDKHYDYCYMSPMKRTVETAIILIGDRVETIPDKRLIEREMGEITNKSRELYDTNKYWDYNLNSGDLGVEKVQDIFERCRDFLRYIIDKHSGQTILIVSHSAILRAIRHILLNTDVNGNLLYPIDNCYYEEIDIDEKKISI
jgi:broad specificity phosphatase PhoE